MFVGDNSKLDVALNAQNNAVMAYSNLNFDSQHAAFQLRYKTHGATTGATAEFRADSTTGPLLASIPLTPQANLTSTTVQFDPTTTITPGNHTVYLLIKNALPTTEPYPVQINWFKYASNQRTTTPIAHTNTKAYATHISGSSVPANATDGDMNTRWSMGHAQTLGHFFMTDFGEPTSVTHSLIISNGGDHLRNYNVEVSDDGLNFTTINTTPSNTSNVYSTSPSERIITRYVRVTAKNQNSIGSWWSIHEHIFANH